MASWGIIFRHMFWAMSSFNITIMQRSRLDLKYYLISDEALPVSNQLLIPYGGSKLDAVKDCFNYHLSAMKQCIERAFGILKRRWGILWRPLMCEFHRWPLIVQVVARLHNVCIDFNVNKNFIATSSEDHMPWDDHSVIFNLEEPEARTTTVNRSQRRDSIAAHIHEVGFSRPLHSRSRIAK